MPYLNDVINSNQNQFDEARRLQIAKAASTSRFLFDPDEVFSSISQRIVGQDESLAAIHDLLHVVKADFSETDRPLYVLMFVGSTGVGKTETVRVLAESILGSSDALCRIDMNTLAQEHYSAALTGAPPGYVGSKENHTLFDVDKIEGSLSRPGIVLLDEVEKASDAVNRALLNVFDSGMLELSAGNKLVNFRNSMIFMTSNVGARELADYRKKFSRGWRNLLKRNPSKTTERAILQKALEARFDPEFINRIDQVLYYAQLDSNWLQSLLSIELVQLNKRLAKRGLELELDASAERYLIEAYDARYGARNIKSRLRKKLEPVLARALSAQKDVNKFKASYGPDGFKINGES